MYSNQKKIEYSSASNIRAGVETRPPPFNRLNKLLYSPPALLSLTFYEILPQAYRLFTVPYIFVRSKVVRSALRAAILVSNVTSSASGCVLYLLRVEDGLGGGEKKSFSPPQNALVPNFYVIYFSSRERYSSWYVYYPVRVSIIVCLTIFTYTPFTPTLKHVY